MGGRLRLKVGISSCIIFSLQTTVLLQFTHSLHTRIFIFLKHIIRFARITQHFYLHPISIKSCFPFIYQLFNPSPTFLKSSKSLYLMFNLRFLLNSHRYLDRNGYVRWILITKTKVLGLYQLALSITPTRWFSRFAYYHCHILPKDMHVYLLVSLHVCVSVCVSLLRVALERSWISKIENDT